MMCKNPWLRANVKSKDDIKSLKTRQDATPFPCGQCLPCRINKARMWQIRIVLEALYSEKKCFVTLTYNDDELPEDSNLEKKEVQKFLKKLRNKFDDRIVRYYIVGEYGERTYRPHYHGALFGLGYEDEKEITETWGKGFVDVGDITSNSARYMSDYVTHFKNQEGDKKLNGKEKEFMLCSKGSKKHPGGLGYKFAVEMGKKLIGKDIDIVDEIKYNGKSYPLGRYLTSIVNEGIRNGFQKKARNYYLYQEKFFNDNLDGSKNYYLAIRESNEGKIASLEFKHNDLFRKRRYL